MTQNSKKLQGKLTISRPSNGSGRRYITIRIHDELSGTEVIDLEIGLEEFAEAVTGMGYVPCEFELQAEFAGKKREIKRVLVECGESWLEAKRTPARQAEYVAQKFAPYEVDGWIGSQYDYFNFHNKNGDFMNVSFTRYVDPEDGER